MYITNVHFYFLGCTVSFEQSIYKNDNNKSPFSQPVTVILSKPLSHDFTILVNDKSNTAFRGESVYINNFW